MPALETVLFPLHGAVHHARVDHMAKIHFGTRVHPNLPLKAKGLRSREHLQSAGVLSGTGAMPSCFPSQSSQIMSEPESRAFLGFPCDRTRRLQRRQLWGQAKVPELFGVLLGGVTAHTHDSLYLTLLWANCALLCPHFHSQSRSPSDTTCLPSAAGYRNL